MKKLIVVLLSVLFVLTTSLSETYAKSSSRVRGYTKKKSGTYVAPHKRTNPDKSKSNNWSTKGNVNPYTGKEGTKDPYKK